MLTKGIDTTIRELVADLPKGTSGANASGVDFEKLVTSLATQISSALLAAAAQGNAQTGAASTPASAATTGSAAAATPSTADRLSPAQLSLLRDRTSPVLEQLSNNLTAGDPQYNQREAQLRDRLDLSEIERRLQSKARELEVSYDVSDLEGILRNAGYDATHLGSSERYMSAIEKYMGEAENNYRQRSTNIPGHNG